MELSKEQILDALYALRAGLSIISEENDKVKEIKIKRLESLIATGCKMQPYVYELISGSAFSTGFYDKLQVNRQSFKQLVNDYGYDFWFNNVLADLYGDEIKNTNFNDKRVLISDVCNKGIDTAVLKNVAVETAYLPAELNEISELSNVGFLHGRESDPKTALAMKGYVCAQWLKSGSCEKFLLDKLACYRAKIFGGKHCRVLEQMLSGLPELMREVEVTESRAAAQLKEIRDRARIYYSALLREFSPVLDVRDWQYIDFVIFYFETRRAETVKEALQLVDREMQTQRIEQLIIAATNQICNTLAIGFTMLQDTMINCCKLLSDQIARSTDAVSSKLSGLTDAVNMSNALKSKANVNGESLMKEVRQLCGG